MVDPGRVQAPGYWMHETSGALRPVIEAYLRGEPMAPQDVDTMRAYLRQWIMAPAWRGDDVEQLRKAIPLLTSRARLRRWLELAMECGIDPL